MPNKKEKKSPDLSTTSFPVVGIGASEGGLEAFKRLLKVIPPNSGIAYVLVQRLDSRPEGMLPALLQKMTSLPVEEIKDEIKVAPDHIYIVPSRKTVIATDSILSLSPRQTKNKHELNLPIDIFFNSLAEVYQSQAIGVVLSETASDGVKGLKAIKDYGGITFRQDIESAQYEGTPENAAKTGIVDFVLPPEQIPLKIIEMMGRSGRNKEDSGNSEENNNDAFKQIKITSLNEQVNELGNYAEAIITTINVPLMILDRQLRVKSANHSFYRTFMVTEADSKGKLFFQLGNGQWDIPELKSLLEKVIPENERFSDYQVRWVFPNIGERIMLLNARELKEEAGMEKLILLAIEDITVKKLVENKLLESERKFRTMADFIPQIIWTAGPDGKLDYFNRQWYALTGFNEQRENPNWLSLVHEDNRQQCVDTWRENIQKGEDFQMECRLKEQQSESFRWFLMKASPIKNESGSVTKWFGSFTGIHEQKVAADELRKAKEQAELAAREAEEAVQSKQQFLSNMSHEIRTPVNSIIGFIKVLKRTELTEKQAEYVNAIKLSGDVLITLINDILDLAKVDAGKMTFEKVPFRLSDTLSSILNLFEPDMREKNIELVKQFDPLIPQILSGDPVRLHQVILNLMNNAVKFTNRGKITVEVRLLRGDKQKVEIEFSISDTGVGIPEDKLNVIFDNFQQAYIAGETRPGGTGLGLSIVKRLIEAQGGTINVKSKLKEGSVFTFTMAFQKTNKMLPAERKEQYRLEAEVPNIRVLIVEDAPLNQVLMTTIMTDFGFKIDVVENGKMAIEKLTQHSGNKDGRYDLIMMDLQMPEMNGFEAASYIRNQLHLDIPIIAITADVTQEALEKSMVIGMNDYVPKPVDEKLLFEKILNLLKIPYRETNDVVEKDVNEKVVQGSGPRYINLTYLRQRTKSDPKSIKDMISVYLEQTPLLLSAMKEGLDKKDWDLLHAAAHKILPSFSIMGFEEKYQSMVKKIQQYEGSADQFENIKETVSKLEEICQKAFTELQGELAALNMQ